MRSIESFAFADVKMLPGGAPRVWLSKTLLVVTLLATVCHDPIRGQVRASGVGFEGLQSTIAIGLGIPHATAIDGAGNVYVTDLIDSEVLRISHGAAGANCTVRGDCTPIGSGFAQPTAVAVDAAGDVFVTDASTQDLYKITPAGAQTTLATGLLSPSGVALASDGTIYVAVSGAIKRVRVGGAVSTFATGPAEPGGLALSTSGNLYLADTGNDRVLAFAAGGAQTTLAIGLNGPKSIALDGAGNLYVTDTGNNRVLLVPTTGVGYVCPGECTVLAVQASTPNGVASDASGNLYVADTGHGQVVKLAQDAEFGVSPVVATNANPATSLTLNYRLYGSSCAAPPAVSVLTRGAANKDFSYAATANICTPGAPDSLAVVVKFAPLSPGLRTGSVQFIDSTGIPQVATYLHGVGKGPRITWIPGVVTSPMTKYTLSSAQTAAPK